MTSPSPPATVPGRPPVPALRAGLDIGGSKVLAAAVDAAGRVEHVTRLPIRTGPEGVLAAAEEAMRALAGPAGGLSAFAGVGVGIPGLVDAVRGEVLHAVNLGVDGLPLGRLLGERLGLPVAVENDVNAAALGAASAMGLAHSDVGYLSIGTGIGAGLVLSGRLHRGAHAAAGEIGHIPVDPGGPPCRCGQRGCLEVLASGSAIAARWPVAEGARGGAAHHLFAAAAAGDERARAVRDEIADHMAAAVRLLVLTVDVDVVVLGGGVAEVGLPLADAVADALRRQAEVSPFLRELDLPARVRVPPAGLPVAAIGAALLAGPGGS